MFVLAAVAAAVTWHSAEASYYSPADSGGAFACTGKVYDDESIIGVAHKTMKCGTRLRFRYKGHYLSARVIDRGPFVAGREFDFTVAAKNKLRCPDLCSVEWRKQR